MRRNEACQNRRGSQEEKNLDLSHAHNENLSCEMDSNEAYPGILTRITGCSIYFYTFKAAALSSTILTSEIIPMDSEIYTIFRYSVVV